MRVDEIKTNQANVRNLADKLPLVHDDGLPNIATWIAEVALQLALLNDKVEKFLAKES